MKDEFCPGWRRSRPDLVHYKIRLRDSVVKRSLLAKHRCQLLALVLPSCRAFGENRCATRGTVEPTA